MLTLMGGGEKSRRQSWGGRGLWGGKAGNRSTETEWTLLPNSSTPSRQVPPGPNQLRPSANPGRLRQVGACLRRKVAWLRMMSTNRR